jgi:hypothetical protein
MGLWKDVRRLGAWSSAHAGAAAAHDPEKACPTLDAGGYPFSEKIMRQQEAKAR